jgi:DNA polymerase III subunit delta
MKVQAEQLIHSLTKNISPLYLISGDEFLLVQEACDAIRKHTTSMGYGEREVFYIETGFNWEKFLSSANNSSLFSDRTLIELHLKSKINESGSKILQNYAKNPAPDKTVLIISSKLDSSQQKTAWFKAIDSYGVITQIWPIELTQLPSWIARRLKSAGLNADQQGIQLLADHVAGNLLSAVQEIEKLSLLYGDGNLTVEQISSAITDNSRFNIFNLLEAAINNKTAAVSRIFDRLKEENIEPTLILWALTNELRSLIKVSFSVKHGLSIDQAMTQNNVWHNRKLLVKKTLGRYDLEQLQNFLKSALSVDMIIKGADSQHLLWHELSRLYLNFADNKLTGILSQ